jgi:N-acetyl-anhydromuramoyl-L-alanine amidase
VDSGISDFDTLSIDPVTGRVAGARWTSSPNCDARPQPGDISLLVVHGISLPPGEFGCPWIDDLFLNRLDPNGHPYFAEIAGLKVSSHLLIRRNGELVQFVPLHLRAWHAGQSSFGGRERCNDFSIGVELEGTDDVSYAPAQYQALSALSRELMRAFPAITPDRIVGHCDIAPGRKTDPGTAFEWARFRRLLSEEQ